MVDGSFALFAVTACKLKIKDCDEGPTDQTVGFFESEVYESTNCFPTSVLQPLFCECCFAFAFRNLCFAFCRFWGLGSIGGLRWF